MSDIVIPRIQGSKWLREAKYISDLKKEQTVKAIKECQQEHPDERVMVRPASYQSQSLCHVAVCVGAGQAVFRFI